MIAGSPKQVVTTLAYDELCRASTKFAPFHSAHEGFAVLKEEVDELWDEIKTKNRSKERMREEALQTAAMALRFVHDICPPEEST